MAKFAQLLARLDALSPKERLLVFAAAALLLFLVWDFALMQPLALREQILDGELARKTLAVKALEAETAAIVARSSQDPDRANRQLLERYSGALAKANEQLATLTERQISPQQMAKVLETVLIKSSQLQFRSLSGLGAQALMSTASESSQPSGEVNAYRHGFRVEFAGGYLETLEYLRELEGLPWVFFWDVVEYEVDAFPIARGAIEVYTLSLTPGWIGV